MKNRIAAFMILIAAGGIVIGGFENSHGSESGSLNVEQINREIVVDFFQLALFEGKVNEAFELYVGNVYIQHNPAIPDGPDAARKFLESLKTSSPQLKGEIKRVIVENNLVVLRIHWTVGRGQLDGAGIDIFRVDKGKIVEHWDVNQAVPAESKNENTMF